MSGHEPGHVPPDHRTTTEFGIPRIAAGEGESTVVDAPLDPDATSVDLPSERRAEETVTDRPVAPVAAAAVAAGDEAPWTARFGAEAETAPSGEPPTAGQVPPTPYTLPAMGEIPAATPELPPNGAGPAASQAHTAPSSPPPAAPASPPFGVPVGPPPAVSASPPPGSPGRRRRPLVLMAGAVAVAVIAAGAVVAFLLSSGGGEEATTRLQPPSASPTVPQGGTATPTQSAGGQAPPAPPPSPVPTSGGGTPSAAPPPVAAPPPGPVVKGDGLTYQVVQQDPGYFEGEFVLTNRTGKPLTNWRLTFDAPGANVKNIWGGRLVRGGSKVEIQNAKGAPAIPVGATWEVRFGAEGTPSGPKGCRVNGSACGF